MARSEDDNSRNSISKQTDVNTYTDYKPKLSDTENKFKYADAENKSKFESKVRTNSEDPQNIVLVNKPQEAEFEFKDDFDKVEKPDMGEYSLRIKQAMKPRTLIVCLGRREAGLDLHVPNIANSLDLDVVSARDIIQKAVSSPSDGSKEETKQ